jgi:hypothetical protein
MNQLNLLERALLWHHAKEHAQTDHNTLHLLTFHEAQSHPESNEPHRRRRKVDQFYVLYERQ